MNKNIDIYWFSGTGNTLFIAKHVRDTLNSLDNTARLFPLEKNQAPNINLKNTIGLLVPVAAQGTFPNVWEFVNHLPESPGTEIFMIDTLSLYSGGIKGPLKRILKKKNYTPLGALEVIMPNTFQKRKSNSIKEENKRNKGLARVDRFIEKLVQGKAVWRDIPFYSDFLGSFYKTQEKAIKWVKLFKKSIDTNCTQCGRCLQLCPMKCEKKGMKYIDIESEKCILCQRCLEYCPHNAILLSGKSYIKNNLITYRDLMSFL